MEIRCVFLEPTEFAEVALRRYSSKPCMLGSSHNCIVSIATISYPASDYDGEASSPEDHLDPRWPTHCKCGYAFQESDSWQVHKSRLYSRDDHLALKTTLYNAPDGSMYYADWYPWKGPDGHCLVVKTPAGAWIVDAPSFVDGEHSGQPWTRTGAPPDVSATPSINFPGQYHGWLRDGFLYPC